MRIINSGSINSDDFHTIDPSAPCVVDLPSAESVEGQTITFKVMPGVSVHVTLRATNGNAIDRMPELSLVAGQCVRLRSDGGTVHPTQHGIGWLIV